MLFILPLTQDSWQQNLGFSFPARPKELLCLVVGLLLGLLDRGNHLFAQEVQPGEALQGPYRFGKWSPTTWANGFWESFWSGKRCWVFWSNHLYKASWVCFLFFPRTYSIFTNWVALEWILEAWPSVLPWKFCTSGTGKLLKPFRSSLPIKKELQVLWLASSSAFWTSTLLHPIENLSTLLLAHDTFESYNYNAKTMFDSSLQG